MLKKDENKKKFLSISKEIENQLEKAFSNRKEEVVKELEEKIRLIKVEAERKIEQKKEEINKEKKELTDYTAFISELENNGVELRNKIDSHLNQSAKHKTEIGKLIELINKELISVRELTQKLDMLRQEADEKAKILKNQLEEKYGIEAKIPESDVLKEKVEVDLVQETEKLRKIKELFEPSEGLMPEENIVDLEVPG